MSTTTSTPPAWTASRAVRSRPFAYSTLFEHPPLPWPAFDLYGRNKPEIPFEVATLCKNESNCTVFLNDGTWFTTWSQGSYEHAVDERIVYSTSRDQGRTWSAPRAIVNSSKEYRVAYGAPFVVPETGRLYLFFHAGAQVEWQDPAYDSGFFHFVYSDDNGATWSERRQVPLPDRDVNIFPGGRLHGWLNHSPAVMPEGDVLLPFSAFYRSGFYRRSWILNPAEAGVIRLDNILTERDAEKLTFTVLPEGPRGIRVDTLAQLNNPALKRLTDFAKGKPEDSAYNCQELTLVGLKDGRWFGVVRTFLGSPGFTVSADRGKTWTAVEPLCSRPGGPPLHHPMTMCPIASLSDGRIILLFTNNDGSERGAKHVWEGNGRTRNPQWFAIAKQVPGEKRNGGLVFGEPRILVEVDDSGEANLKTGISMPQFWERDGRYFVAYNINKEHLLLDEIPKSVIDEMTPS